MVLAGQCYRLAHPRCACVAGVVVAVLLLVRLLLLLLLWLWLLWLLLLLLLLWLFNRMGHFLSRRGQSRRQMRTRKWRGMMTLGCSNVLRGDISQPSSRRGRS